jgi:hypothetical protein
VILDRLRDLEASATPAPWQLSANDYIYTGRWFGLIAKIANDMHNDAILIVESRNALPDLIERLGQAEAALQKCWDMGQTYGEIRRVVEEDRAAQPEGAPDDR